MPDIAPLLTHCTLTGVDDSTDLRPLGKISAEYPKAEWGFLYFPKKQGSPGRYPSVGTLKRAFETLPRNVRVSLHVCGTGVANLLAGEPIAAGLFQLVRQRGGRLQLNFDAKQSGMTPAKLKPILFCNPGTPIITQYNESNRDIWQPLQDFANHAVLFDSSLGRGVSPGEWVAPLNGVPCGYAGGLGPANLARQLEYITRAAGDRMYWIDMEGKLRTGQDRFSIDAAVSCLEIVDTFYRVKAKQRGRVG